MGRSFEFWLDVEKYFGVSNLSNLSMHLIVGILGDNFYLQVWEHVGMVTLFPSIILFAFPFNWDNEHQCKLKYIIVRQT